MSERRLRVVGTTSFRLAMGASAMLAAASAVQLALVWWQAGRFERDRIDRLIEGEVASLSVEPPADLRWHVERHLGPTLRMLTVTSMVDAGQRVVAGDLDAYPASLPRDGRAHLVTVRMAGHAIRVRATSLGLPGGGALVIGREMRELSEIRGIVLRALVTAFLPALLVSLAGGALLGRRALRRVGDMHRAVDRIMEGGLHERLPIAGADDDLDLLAEQVNRMLARIEGLVAEVSGVGNDIAHDLRTPLARVRTTLDRAQREDADPAQVAACIARAIGDLDRVFAIITALLRINELEDTRRRAGFTPASLAAIAADAVELYEPVAEARDIALRVVAEDAATIACDPDLVMEAVANLLDNAIKFTEPGGHVTVRAAGAAITVEDDGIGLSDEDRLALPQRFYRADRSRHVPGNGLGLSLVAAIAALHGATLSISSAAKGSRFELAFAARVRAASETVRRERG